ncbi:MAG: flagellar hook-length control protein FliK [Thermodesulfobacteriota bacterium]|nr:flagellar hook-length control protein FliK [Thermodesulfobacteriota bacterium]
MAINPVNAASLLNFVFGLMNGDPKRLNDGNVSGDFSSLIKKCAKYAGTAGGAADAVRGNKTPDKSGPDAALCLDALRKGLLKKGKSPDQVYLNKNDSHMLAGFLRECGFPETKVKEYIAGIFENRADGMIRLSDFIAGAEKLRDSEKEKKSPVILESSAVPKIESVLIGSGLTLMESGRLLSSSRADGGGLNIDKLISGIKKSGNIGKEGRSKIIQQSGGLKEEKETGIRTGSGRPDGKDELIAALETFRNAAGGEPDAADGALSVKKDTSVPKPGREGDIRFAEKIVNVKKEFAAVETDSSVRISPDVKASIDRIIEKATESGEKFELRQAGTHVAESWITRMEGGKKGAGSGKIQEGAGKTAHMPGVGEERYKGGSGSDESLRQEKISLLSEMRDLPGHEKGTGSETFDNLILKNPGVLKEGTVIARNESFASGVLNQNGGNSFPPEYTMDRLGIQISRSIAKGDGVIKLQLTPPELGTVNLSMKLKENSLYLGIVAENSSAKELLAAGYNDLKNSLADQGIRLEALDVQVDQNSGRSFMNLNEDSEREHDRYQKNNGDLLPENEIREDLPPGQRSRPGTYYLLDLEA